MERNFKKLIEELYTKREYRPVAAVVLYRKQNGKREFLLFQSAKNEGEWMLPQGGIEQEETSLLQGLARELEEESGINLKRDVEIIQEAFHYETLDAEKTRKDKRGFTKGKAYLFSLGNYKGESNFSLQEEEIQDAEWLDYEMTKKRFSNIRKEKGELSMRALNKAIEIINANVS